LLDAQIHVYSLDTGDFYNEAEMKIHKHMTKCYIHKHKLQQKYKKADVHLKLKIDKWIKKVNSIIKERKKELCILLKLHEGIRQLHPDSLKSINVVSIFESTLTRVLNIPTNTLCEDIIIIRAYYFDVLESLILNGFIHNGERYVCFTASAGQIRTKKTVFIRESVLMQHRDTLMCGLTIETINKFKGVNINKYLAYLALCNSATDLWVDFDINKTIIVDDLETSVRGFVDFIDDKTYIITRQEMDVNIAHTDGAGMILPSVSKKNFMIRLPWIKGLLVSFPYDKFIKELNDKNPNKNHAIVKDIYGKEHDVIAEEIEIIFTKSQFKMYKYYQNTNNIKESWQMYKDNFIKYNCQAGICNIEENCLPDTKGNYQILQTLTDINDNELEHLASITNENINNIGKDKKTMLKVLGITKFNKKKNYIQQAIELYPELIHDNYSKEILKQVKKSLVKEGRSGKLELNGKYTFISPDIYAFCEYLFGGIKNPIGLLQDQEVFCKLYPDVKKLDCLRSPHLYREHAIRNNIIDDIKKQWFTTDALYISCHDLISKILQLDVDGDKSLVVADQVLVDVAERNMKDIVPLHYEMKKASSITISNTMIYSGLKWAYTGGNIGMISNDITKIWNSDNINLDAVKILCMESNFTIDYAKTLYKPERPPHIKTLISDYTKSKTPHFFIYAKDKLPHQVESINNSAVNRLFNIIKNVKLHFKSNEFNVFDYKQLLSSVEVDIDLQAESSQLIINKYKELDLKQHYMINLNEIDKKTKFIYAYQTIKQHLLDIEPDEKKVVDILVEYLYGIKKSNFKTTLWECFGDTLVNNLKTNIKKKYIYCAECGELVEQKNNRHHYCKLCSIELIKKRDRERKRIYE
jgi:Zn finger protein HypA/HybF involved in hydrogenase expression